MKKPGTLFLGGFIFLVLCGVEGTSIIRYQRCSCISTSQGKINSKTLRDLKQFAPSPTCEKMEIIATLKNGDQTCLNPDSEHVKKLVQDWEKQISQKKKQKKMKHQKSKKVRKVNKPKQRRQKKTA
uniref:C-X-C motif chemokine 9 n=1 Tax=Jaculus jaculus TaxID=51337 RepID=UPI001E1B0728|nr:C-X-C motif chemokine 9 [Jaculus jaculus]